MTQTSNRLTTHFALMLQARPGQSHQQVHSGWQPFTQVITNATDPFKGKSGDVFVQVGLPAQGGYASRDLSFEPALSQPGISTQIPIPRKRYPRSTPNTFSGQGLWDGLEPLFNRSLASLADRLTAAFKPVLRSLPPTRPNSPINLFKPDFQVPSHPSGSPLAQSTQSHWFSLSEAISIHKSRTTQQILNQSVSPTNAEFSPTISPAQIIPTLVQDIRHHHAKSKLSQALITSTLKSVEHPIIHLSKSHTLRTTQHVAPSLSELLNHSPQQTLSINPLTIVNPQSSQPTPPALPDPSPIQNSSRTPMVQQIRQLQIAMANPPKSPTAETVPSPSSSPTMTVQGGIHVHITANTVDPAHAQETARVIAEQVIKEANRISDRNRFRRGLSNPHSF